MFNQELNVYMSCVLGSKILRNDNNVESYYIADTLYILLNLMGCRTPSLVSSLIKFNIRKAGI